MVRIRTARLDEADALTAIGVRATRHDGYDEAMMRRLMPMLAVDSALLAAGLMFAAEDDGALRGVMALRHTGLGGLTLLDRLFVAPEATGRGIGRQLFGAAVAHTKAIGSTALLVYANPNAAGFYARMGAIRIGETPYLLAPEIVTPIFVMPVS